MLEISGVKAGYGSMSVLHGIDMVVNAGEIVALLGSNGVGKTTLNNVISGFIRPTAGSVRFDGHALNALKPRDIVALGIAHVPEGRKIFPNLTVRENLELGAFRRGQANKATNFERICTIFPRLRERLSQLAGTLSGGEQQMLAIARALCLEPDVLLLDEPTEGLQPSMIALIRDTIQTLKGSGLATVLVEQRVDAAVKLADRIAFMAHGRIEAQLAGAEITAASGLFRQYVGV